MKYDEVALIKLGFSPSSIPDQDELEESLDEAVYQESNYFLKRDYLPKLAQKRIDKLKNLCLLSKQLKITDNPVDIIVSPNLFADSDIVNLVGTYNSLVSKFKLELTKTSSPCQIIQVYEVWKVAFTAFAIKYCVLFEKHSPNKEQYEKKRSANTDFVELLEELKLKNYGSKARQLYHLLKTQI